MKNTCLFLLVLVLASCSSNKAKHQEQGSEADSLSFVSLAGETLSCDSTLWGLSLDMIGEHRLLVEELSSPLLYGIYDIREDKLVKEGSLLRKGNGPHEVSSPEYQCTDSTFLIANYSGTLRTIYRMKHHDLFHEEDWETIKFPTDHGYLLFPYFVMLNDSLCVMTGSKPDSDKILTYVNLKSGAMGELDFSFPGFHLSTDLKTAEHLVYCDAQLAKHPSDEKFVYTCRLGRYVEIIEMCGSEIVRQTSLFDIHPLYKVDGHRRIIEDECLQGAVTKVTENRIYCLITPYTQQEAMEKETYKGYPNYFSDELYVFDWSGKQVGAYRLDVPVCSFCVDETDSTIYASTLDEEDFIVRKFRLKQ